MFLTILGWIGLFFAGILLGLFVVLLLKVKKTRKKISDKIEKKKSINACDKQEVNDIVKAQCKIYKRKNRFHVFKTVIGLKPKTKGYFAMYGDIINGVAKIQNPESQNPFLEFTLKQAFDFVEMVTIDLESILNDLQMPMLKNVDVSNVFGVVDFKNKVLEIKAVKSVIKITRPFKPIKKLLALLNPIRWVSTLITAIFTASLTKDLIFASADVVAYEFANFYSKCKNENLVLAESMQKHWQITLQNGAKSL